VRVDTIESFHSKRAFGARQKTQVLSLQLPSSSTSASRLGPTGETQTGHLLYRTVPWSSPSASSFLDIEIASRVCKTRQHVREAPPSMWISCNTIPQSTESTHVALRPCGSSFLLLTACFRYLSQVSRRSAGAPVERRGSAASLSRAGLGPVRVGPCLNGLPSQQCLFGRQDLQNMKIWCERIVPQL